MNSRDSFKDNRNEKIPVDDYFDGIEHSSFQKGKTGFNLSKFIGMPLFITGAGVIILIILVSIIFNKPDEAIEVGEQEGIPARIKKLEDRIVELEKFEQKLAELEKQGAKLGLLQNRMDRLETNVASRLDRLPVNFESTVDKKVKESKTIIKNSAERSSVGGKKKTGSKTMGKYHQVLSGETLYGIGQKYNLSLEELLRLNPSLSRRSSIHPGQQIRIASN
jgi:LysM repeat protein